MAGAILVEHYTWDTKEHRFVTTGQRTEANPDTLESTAATRPLRGLFLKGPVPWSWIIVAAGLPGKALIVGLCLWRLAGATKKRAIVLGNNDLAPFGVDRAAKSRALAALEDAGLISIERKRGRFPIVTILTR